MTTAAATRVVPWITLWSDEIIPVTDIRIRPGLDRLRYLDETRDDWFMDVLWHRERTNTTGNPVFAQVHSRRQRRAMLDPRCQVCGTRLPKRNVPWLFSTFEMERFDETGMFTTNTAPTCSACQSVAALRCPHLRHIGTVRAEVGSITPVGILGDLYHPFQRDPRVEAPFSSPLVPHMLAKQLIVQLNDFRQVDQE